MSIYLQKANSVDVVPGSDIEQKKKILELRRVLLLALVGGTPNSNPAVDRILETVYLFDVKVWLDDVLNGSIGMFFL